MGYPHNTEVEMDQYDTPQAWYACVHRRGEIIGGADHANQCNGATWIHWRRLCRASSRYPKHNHALGIETDDVWECTRLVLDGSVRTAHLRARCLDLICNGLVSIAHNHGAHSLITLTRVPLMRTLRGLGFDVSYLGTPYTSAEDGHLYAVLQMPAAYSQTMMAAE